VSQAAMWWTIAGVCFAISLGTAVIGIIIRNYRQLQSPAPTRVTVDAVPLRHADGTPLTAGELKPGELVTFDPKTGVISLVQRLNAAKLDRPASASDKRP
jgi:hypothetical protein